LRQRGERFPVRAFCLRSRGPADGATHARPDPCGLRVVAGSWFTTSALAVMPAGQRVPSR
jgi:hypothetical protein